VELLFVLGLGGVAALCLCMPALIKAETRHKRKKDPHYRPPGSFGVIDEIFHPTAYSAFQEVETQKEVPAPPAPGDPDRLRRR
jgi:hypothetical protein